MEKDLSIPILPLDSILSLFLDENKIIKIGSKKAFEKLFCFLNKLKYKIIFNKDLLWEGLYLSIKENGKIILIPVYIRKVYKKENSIFIILSNLGSIELISEDFKKENCQLEIEKIVENIILTTLKVKEDYKLLNFVPFSFRKGKIKSKYVFKPRINQGVAKLILLKYKLHVKNMNKIESICLNDYLRVAAICYRAVFGKEVKGLTEKEMYERFSDFRRCGILDLDPNNREAFQKWMKEIEFSGCHPFEIIPSNINFGIILYPPTHEKPYFVLRMGNLFMSEKYVKIVIALINNNVPFIAPDIYKALKYLTGEYYIRVNDIGSIDETIFVDENSELKKFVEWEKLPLPEFK